jgi:hypothetical protein
MLHAADFLNLKFSFRWQDRKQSPQECAALALEYMQLVKATVPGFKTWRQVEDDKRKAVSLTRPALTKLFSAGFQLDTADKPVERFGYKVFLTTSSPALGFVGAYMHFGGWGRGHENVAVLDVYLTSKKAKSVFSLARCRKFCEQALAILEPNQGVVDNLELFKQAGLSGWIVYLSNARAEKLPKLPRGVVVRPIKKQGVMLIAADKSFPKVPPGNLKTLQALGKALALRVMPGG